MKINVEIMCIISAIMDKIQIDSSYIKELFEKGKKAKGKSKQEVEALQTEIGAELLFLLGKKIHLVKDEIIQFIAIYKGISEEEAKDVDIISFIKEVSKDEGLTSFLRQKAMSMQKKK